MLNGSVVMVPPKAFLKAKAGPYLPFTAQKRAPWAPAENAPEAARYLAGLLARRSC